MDIKLKAKLFRWSCVAILTYGSESWILTQKLANQINTFATTAYRKMLNINWSDRVSNERLYELTGQRPLSEIIQQRQLRFIGHSLRRNPTEPINQYALYTPKENHWLEKGYYQKLHAAGKEEKEVCQLLICVGFILDGRLSLNEKLQIRELQQEGLISLSVDRIKQYQKDFLNGRGIQGLIRTYIA